MPPSTLPTFESREPGFARFIGPLGRDPSIRQTQGMSTEVAIPPAQTLIWPTIEGLRSLDGSGTIAELNQRVAQLAQLTEAQQSVPHGVGNRSEVEYRMAWARTNAKLLGLVENSERAVWSLTELGRKVTLEKFEALIRERRSKLGKERRAKQRDSKRAGEQSGEQGDEIPETDEDDLLADRASRRHQANEARCLRTTGEEAASRSRVCECDRHRRVW